MSTSKIAQRETLVWYAFFVFSAMSFGCSTTTTGVHVDPQATEIEAKKQREFAARDYLTNSVRIGQISYPLLKAASVFCDEKQRSGVGIEVANKYMFPKDLHGTVWDMWELGDELVVVGVAENGPADVAGLRFGDRIVQIGDDQVKSGRRAADNFLARMRSDAGEKELRFVVDRRDETVEVTLAPEVICDYNILLSMDDTVNAFADGRNLIVTTGMARFASTDYELSIVLGHEIAHNAMGHIDKQRGNATLGSIFDIAAAAAGVNTQGAFGNIAARAFSQEFEAEADYVGLYIVARSGMPVDRAPDFWRKMAVAYPSSIKKTHGATHPTTPERFVALEEASREISAKLEMGDELEPNYKRDKEQ